MATVLLCSHQAEILASEIAHTYSHDTYLSDKDLRRIMRTVLLNAYQDYETYETEPDNVKQKVEDLINHLHYSYGICIPNDINIMDDLTFVIYT